MVPIKRGILTTLQVNMGDLCNQECSHCHVGASAEGKNSMDQRTVGTIIDFISRNKGLVLDITGGAPELNPNFRMLVESASPFVKDLIVRSNLTVIFEPGMEYLPEFYKAHKVHLICSLPCYTKENVDAQRGKGVFEKSIKALKLLNGLGYAVGQGLTLDLAYNPGGAFLPGKQQDLEKDYKLNLKKNHGVGFNRLITLTNAPIKRFREYLEGHGSYGAYISLLKNNFNPDAVLKVMCRHYLSIGPDSKVYDCDFNQSLGMFLTSKQGEALRLEDINTVGITGQLVRSGEHCLCCAAAEGSSCQGALCQVEESQ